MLERHVGVTTSRSYKVTLVYRKPTHYRKSIERVFSRLDGYRDPAIEIRSIVLPSDLVSVRGLMESFGLVKNVEGWCHITGDVYPLVFTRRFHDCSFTFHDSSVLSGKRFFKKLILWLFWFFLPTFWAAKIACVSDASSQQLNRITFNLFKNKISVIKNEQVLFNKSSQINIKRTIDLLIIGSKANKNVDFLLNTNLKNLRIVFVGDYILKVSPVVTALMEKNRVSIFSNVSDQLLRHLYCSAKFLFFLSKDEGYGLPVEEAEIAGCIPIVSNLEVMNEVAGPFAIKMSCFNYLQFSRLWDFMAQNVSGAFINELSQLQIVYRQNRASTQKESNLSRYLQFFQDL